MDEAARIERRAMEAQTPKKPRPEPPLIHHGLTEQEKHERIIAFMSVPTSLMSSVCNHVTHLFHAGRIKHQMMMMMMMITECTMTKTWNSTDRHGAANTSTRMTGASLFTSTQILFLAEADISTALATADRSRVAEQWPPSPQLTPKSSRVLFSTHYHTNR